MIGLDEKLIIQWTNHLVEMVRVEPSWLSGLILFAAACIEYLFPPFPGDTIMVAGGFFAARGAISPVATIIALVAGSVFGSAMGWGMGRCAFRFESTRRLTNWLIKPVFRAKLEALYVRHGVLILLANRFLPGLRGAFMIAAGLANFPLGRVLFWGSISAILWNSFLLLIGYFFSENLETLIDWVNSYTKIMLLLILGVVLFFVVRWLVKYHRRSISNT